MKTYHTGAVRQLDSGDEPEAESGRSNVGHVGQTLGDGVDDPGHASRDEADEDRTDGEEPDKGDGAEDAVDLDVAARSGRLHAFDDVHEVSGCGAAAVGIGAIIIIIITTPVSIAVTPRASWITTTPVASIGVGSGSWKRGELQRLASVCFVSVV